MKNILGYLLIAVLIAIMSGCGGSFEPPEAGQEQKEKPSTQPEDKYNPLDRPEDFTVVPSVVSMHTSLDSAQSEDSNAPLELSMFDSTRADAGQVYRIQLFTSKEYGPAFREKNIAREVFDKLVSLDYEVPYYKVRVGNFKSLEDAEQYLPAAREAGYKTAWVVKSYVNIRSLEDTYKDVYDEDIYSPVDSADTIESEMDTLDDIIEYQEN